MAKKTVLKRKNKKKKRKNLFFGFIFIVGLLTMCYPIVSNIYYRIESNEQITDFENEKAKLTDAEIEERMRLAQAYNDSLNNGISGDPYSDEMLKQGRAEYARMLEIHERIGHVEIPAIDVDIPMYAGTSEEVLQIGAGHLEGTSLPIGGNSSHSVITAHTGLPSAKMFTDLTKLKVGDKFYVHNLKETLAYQVDDISVIEPTDFSKLLIVPGHDYVTLLTCTPYMVNTHRLLVRGHQVEYVPAVDEEFIAENRLNHFYRYLFYVALVLIAILLYIIHRLRRKKRQSEMVLKKLKAEQEVEEKEVSREEARQ
ncbi:class C sortase [Streptococcus moroccensis]|uniref:Sortase A n=1 Tax=Streptococcus moroccensis TaxID=1451356 RepID=A0ABT9YTV9_9STRE|nr:class C sortase [Streptococcus moroccensis]MDQ0223435.1 sortase A [Streptococcus moroccensis]